MSFADLRGAVAVSTRWLRTWPRRYLFALAAVTTATVARLSLDWGLGFTHPFVFYYPAVLIVALLASFWPGIVATILSALAGNYLFLPPRSSLAVHSMSDRIELALFLLVGVTISCFAAAFRNSASRYRLLFEKNIAGIAVSSVDGTILECNDAWASMVGCRSAAEVRGRETREFYLKPDDRESVLNQLTTPRSGVSGELQMRRIDGKAIWVLFKAVFRESETGEQTFQATAIDITEQKEAEEARRKSEEHFRILVEQASDAIGIADRDGRWIDINTAWAELLGYTREEILQKIVGDNIVAADQARVASALARSAGGETVRAQLRARRKDGSVIPIEASMKRLPDGGFQVIARDVTERERAAEAIRRNEERFRVALKDSPITVFNQDHDLRYTWIYNPQMYWQHDVLGKTDEEILGPRIAAMLTQLKLRVLQTGTALREEVSIRQNDRSWVFDMTLEPVFEADEVAGITGACVDIARFHEMADRLQQSRDRLAREKSYLESEIQTELGFEQIIGQSSALRETLNRARIVAPTDSSVLLLGETGTGKELVARSLHRLSSRRENTFVKLNCAAVPSGLLESELFGHERGAFTSAVNQKIGRIELADKGTLFLDEIGELPPELQPKLLRVLQDREFERLGGVKTLRVDVRIISATNRDLQDDVSKRKFREDLYYRLNVFPILLPPLRERREDILVLVRHFVEKHATRMRKPIDTIPDETLKILRNWSWPGNVRELENMIERMVILTKGRVLAAPSAELVQAEDVTDDNLTEMERDHIIRVLQETNGVLSGLDGAASRLGLKRTTLQSMMKRLGIEAHTFRRMGASAK